MAKVKPVVIIFFFNMIFFLLSAREGSQRLPCAMDLLFHFNAGVDRF